MTDMPDMRGLPSASPTIFSAGRSGSSLKELPVPLGGPSKPVSVGDHLSVRAARPWVPLAVRRAVYLRDELTCWLCGQPATRTARGPADPLVASVDHVTPHSAGGADTAENLRTAHRGCNILRGAGRGPAPGSPAYRWALQLAVGAYRAAGSGRCLARGCQAAVRCSARCGRHYRSWCERRWNLNPDRPTCPAAGCRYGAAYGAGGYCARHGRFAREHGGTARSCRVDGCDRRLDGGGYCARHRSRLRRYGTPTPARCGDCSAFVPAGAERCGRHDGRPAPRPPRRRRPRPPCFAPGCWSPRWGVRMYCAACWWVVPRCALDCEYPIYPGMLICTRHKHELRSLAIAAA